MTKFLTFGLTSLALSLSLASCEYKELCYDHSHIIDVRIDYDWRDAPDATASGMSAYLFNLDLPGTMPERFDFSGRQGGSIRLANGNFATLGVNHDTEAILYRNTESVGSFEAYTRRSSLEEGTLIASRAAIPFAAGTTSQPVVLEPDELWGGSGEELNLAFGQQGGHATIYPKHLVKKIRIELHNVPNLQYTSQFGGSVSGLASSVKVATGEISEDHVIIAFPIRKEGDDTLVAEFLTFGHCPHADAHEVNEHIFTLYAVLADGQKWYYSEDVTEQMHDPLMNPDQEHITIQLTEPPIPKPIVNGSGFHPEVDEWVNEEIIVDMLPNNRP